MSTAGLLVLERRRHAHRAGPTTLALPHPGRPRGSPWTGGGPVGLPGAASGPEPAPSDGTERRAGGATCGRRRDDRAPVAAAVVGSRMEAELIAGLLRSNGIGAAVSADDAGGQEPQLQLDGVRVLVAAADEAAARKLLADVEAGEAPR